MRFSEVIIGLAIIVVIFGVMTSPLGLITPNIINETTQDKMQVFKNSWDFSNGSNTFTYSNGTVSNATSPAHEIQIKWNGIRAKVNEADPIGATLAMYDFLISTTLWVATIIFSSLTLFLLPLEIFQNMLSPITRGIPILDGLLTALFSILMIVVPITIIFFVIRFATGRDDTI
jgi:hypothetical protein